MTKPSEYVIMNLICIVIMTVLLLLQCILNQSVQWRFNAFTLETVSGGNVSILLYVVAFVLLNLQSVNEG